MFRAEVVILQAISPLLTYKTLFSWRYLHNQLVNDPYGMGIVHIRAVMECETQYIVSPKNDRF